MTDAFDTRRLTPLQVSTFCLCALVAVLDGIDTQSIGLAAPLLGRAFHLSKPFLGLVFSVSQVGAVAGALIFGSLGDRFGRKTSALVCVAAIALFTALTAVASGPSVLLLVRFLAGIGLGGAIPSVLALTSEYAPARLRGTLVSAVFAGYPIGATLGGFAAAPILQHSDWRWVFYAGALATLVVLGLAAAFLPESVRFLAGRGASGAARASRTLRRLGIEPGSDGAWTPEGEAAPSIATLPPWAVFGPGLLGPSLALGLVFFFVFATTKVMTVWLPVMLTQAGFAVSAAAMAQAAFNGGAGLGMLVAGRLTDRLGAGRALIPSLLLATLCAGLIGGSGRSLLLTATATGFCGLFVGIGGSGAYALAARLYPVALRSTGLGWGTAASRFGQVVSPLLVGALLGAGAGGAKLYGTIAALPFLGALAVAAFALLHRPARAVLDEADTPLQPSAFMTPARLR